MWLEEPKRLFPSKPCHKDAWPEVWDRSGTGQALCPCLSEPGLSLASALIGGEAHPQLWAWRLQREGSARDPGEPVPSQSVPPASLMGSCTWPFTASQLAALSHPSGKLGEVERVTLKGPAGSGVL